MNIHVINAVGKGRTVLSAFDNALQKAGVCNYNLITLSSIIPPGSRIVTTKKYYTPPEQFGYKLYIIKAEMRSEKKGEYIAAGMGWYQLVDGRGFFVEHELKAKTKQAAEEEIEDRVVKSLQDLCAFRRVPFKKKQMHSSIVIAQVKAAPTCALVLAVYQSEGWQVKRLK